MFSLSVFFVFQLFNKCKWHFPCARACSRHGILDIWSVKTLIVFIFKITIQNILNTRCLSWTEYPKVLAVQNMLEIRKGIKFSLWGPITDEIKETQFIIKNTFILKEKGIFGEKIKAWRNRSEEHSGSYCGLLMVYSFNHRSNLNIKSWEALSELHFFTSHVEGIHQWPP